MIAFLKDLVQTLGTDWGMWLMVLAGICLVCTAAKWVMQISGWLGDAASR